MGVWVCVCAARAREGFLSQCLIFDFVLAFAAAALIFMKAKTLISGWETEYNPIFGS